MKEKFQSHADKFRFGLVGVINTVFDFSVLFGLVFFGFDKIIANYISTTLAFILSFSLNRSYTFKSHGAMKKQIIPFLTVTLFGLWVIQPLLIWLLGPLVQPLFSEPISLLVLKVIATAVTMVWNYILYKRVVFTA